MYAFITIGCYAYFAQFLIVECVFILASRAHMHGVKPDDTSRWVYKRVLQSQFLLVFNILMK